MLHGTPEDMIDGVAPYVQAGATHVVLHNMGFLADPGSARGAFRLLAETARLVDERFNTPVDEPELALR
jgi:hypothetical protein